MCLPTFQNQNQNMKPQFIWEKEQILSFLDQADRLLEITLNGDNPEEVIDRMAHIITLFPSSSNAVASAKWWREHQYKIEYKQVYERYVRAEQPDHSRTFVSASILKDYINARVGEWTSIVSRAERQNAAITHSLDALRSILSSLKEERKISNYSTAL